jgi:hypothetical protein
MKEYKSIKVYRRTFDQITFLAQKIDRTKASVLDLIVQIAMDKERDAEAKEEAPKNVTPA